MKPSRWIQIFAGALALSSSAALLAQTTAGAGSVLVIPIVAQTGTYQSEIFVRNPNDVPLQVNVKFYEAQTSTTPGLRPCNPLALAAQQTIAMQLVTQCTLGDGNHHGMLILENAETEKTHVFQAYNRTQAWNNNGFSVEAFPIGNFSGAAAGANGLKRQAATPFYQTNCFVAALGEAVDYKIRLYDANNTQIGTDVDGSLQPFQMRRYLDIFTFAGLTTGDYSTVRAVFDNTNAGEPAYVGFCTVQESVFFGADFRIAKSGDAQDSRQRRQVCYSQDPCGTVAASGPPTITDFSKKNIHQMMIQQPDYIKCELVSARLDDLEMQIRGPGDVFTSPVWASSPPYDSGGNGKTSFYIYTGARNAVNGGWSTRWFIDVSHREPNATTGDITYGITCYSGNGVSVPWVRGSDIDDF